MKKLILITLLVWSCGSKQDDRYVCTCEENKEASAFVERNIKAANNMSDEEMEDVIKELTRTAIKFKCHQEVVWLKKPFTIDWSKQEVDSCKTIHVNIF